MGLWPSVFDGRFQRPKNKDGFGVDMPTVKVRNLKNEEIGEVQLSDAVFGAPLNEPLIHAAVRNFMGKGKGAPEYWVAVVKPGRILYEIEGVDLATARDAMRLAAQKLPIRTKFVTRADQEGGAI